MDAVFAVHTNNMKSQSESIFTLGKGIIINISLKQKCSVRSSTEDKLNTVNDKILAVIQTKKFIEYQNFNIKLNVIFQDNTSTIKLLEYRKESSGKRIHHYDIRLFYIIDLINSKEGMVKYCLIDRIWADYNTKPLVGKKFSNFRNRIMNLSDIHHLVGQQECAGETHLSENHYIKKKVSFTGI